MPNYTHAVVMGNLTRDPELRYLPTGTAVCDFTVAVNSGYQKDGGEKVERVDFFDVTLYKRLGEVAAEYLKKGRGVFVSGPLRQERWEDEKTRQKRSRIRLVGQELQFLGGGSRDGAPSEGAPSAGASTEARPTMVRSRTKAKAAPIQDPFAP